MYTLYYLPGSCSMAVHVVLNEIGAEFKLENVTVPKGEPRADSFLKINPRGNVPVLKQDDFVLREGAAILLHLIETHKSPLLPASGKERATALEWLSFANSSLHPAYGRAFFLAAQLGEKCAEDTVYAAAIQSIQKLWNDIEERLTKSKYLAGNEISVADILITVIANWSKNLHKSISFGPKTKELFAGIIERPSYRKALEVEKVEYKIAA
jgi:glutathione S-transferase